MRVYDYVTAELWLKGGKKKTERPLYTRGARLFQRADHIAVALGWAQSYDVVLYYPDGTTTIQSVSPNGYWNPLWSQGVRGIIRDFSGVHDVHQRDSKWYIVEANPAVTPPKIQGCRICKSSGMQDELCWGPGTCYRELPCELHPTVQVDPQRPNARWHDADQCTHGKAAKHMMYKAHECYYCGGTGKRDYGSKLVSLQWDGFPVRLREGKVIKQEPTELEKRIANYVKPNG
jgi:hypothetical protein